MLMLLIISLQGETEYSYKIRGIILSYRDRQIINFHHFSNLIHNIQYITALKYLVSIIFVESQVTSQFPIENLGRIKLYIINIGYQILLINSIFILYEYCIKQCFCKLIHTCDLRGPMWAHIAFNTYILVCCLRVTLVNIYFFVHLKHLKPNIHQTDLQYLLFPFQFW